MSDVPVYTPSEWGENAAFFEGIEDRRQRRALALIQQFGTPGGCDKVCFIGDMIVIASVEPCDNYDVDLVVRPLDEFIAAFSATIERDADPMALRWVEKVVHWPELGC
jgi:hypothetical protein